MAKGRLNVTARRALIAGIAVAWWLNGGASLAHDEPDRWRFAFAPGKVEPGCVQVTPATTYTKERGYGFDLGSNVTAVDRGGDPNALRGGYCTGAKPFFFSVAVPEGNYHVTVTLGDRAGASAATVKAESRRLMLEDVRTAAGEFATRTFTVNVRGPRIASGGEVRLNERERGALHWDGKLTLEFAGRRPCLAALAIARADDAVTVYLAGDSTVTDQTRAPWAGWGQMLPRFFGPGVAVANHAESGRALKSFLAEKRLDKVLDAMRPGDYLFIQFGHNDMKKGGAYAEAFTDYKGLLKRYVAAARRRGAVPVLVTSMHRRRFDTAGKVVNTLGDYPEAVRQAAREEGVALIDLNAMSKDFYEALGPETSRKAFVDNTHTNEYGAYQFARFIAAEVRRGKLPLAKHVVSDLPPPNFKPE